MILKTAHTLTQLRHLTECAQETEKHFREAASSMKRGSEKALFIHFWQEHARMVNDLREKTRMLGGKADLQQTNPWGGLHFKVEPVDSEVFEALAACERSEMHMLQEYELAVKMPLPFDVNHLFKLHTVKIRGFLARLQEFTAYLHRQVHTAQLETAQQLLAHSL